MSRYKTIKVIFEEQTQEIFHLVSDFAKLKRDISIYFPAIKGDYKIYIPGRWKDRELDESRYLEFINNKNNNLKIIEINNYKELSKSSLTTYNQKAEVNKDRIVNDDIKNRFKDKFNLNYDKTYNTENEIKEKYRNIEKEFKELNEKYIQLEKDNKELNDKLINYEVEKKGLNRKLIETENEKNELEKKLKLENKNALINGNTDNENPIIQKIQKENDELNQKLLQSENENKNLKEKIIIIEKKRKELNQKSENENNDLQNIEDQKQESNEEIVNENKDLKDQLLKLNKENQDLQLKIQNIENEKIELNEKLKNNEKENENEEIIENRIKTIEEEKNKEINELQMKIKQLNQIINKMNENNNNKMKNLESEKNYLENNINKEFEKGNGTITNQIKYNIQTEISKFQNDLFLKIKNLNSKFLEEQKQNLIKTIENSHKRIKEDEEENEEINNKNLKSINNQNQQPKLIHEGFKCNLCNKTPIIGLRYKCNFCYDFNLCENCYNDILHNKKSHYNNNNSHKFIKIDKIIKKSNNANQRGSSAPKQVSSKTEIFKKNYIDDTPKDDYTLFTNLSNHNSPKNSIFINEEESKIFFDEMSKPFQKDEQIPRSNNNENNNNENENEIDDDLIYSYKAEKYMIEKKIKPGVSKTSILINIINDGENQYKKGITKFVSDNNSRLNCNPYIIPPLKKNEKTSCLIVFEGLNELVANDYLIFLNFIVGNKIFGQQITIKLKIESDELREKITLFRKQYQLSARDFSDEVIMKSLKQHNFKFEETFDSLFN